MLLRSDIAKDHSRSYFSEWHRKLVHATIQNQVPSGFAIGVKESTAQDMT